MIWRLIAWLCSRRRVSAWLIHRAQRTPYSDLFTDGSVIWRMPAGIQPLPGYHVYMRRWWLFRNRWFEARIHNIRHPDPGRDPHNHPWPFRTIVLRGYYVEKRDRFEFMRLRGSTYRLDPDQFHQITQLCLGGAWTLFITTRKRGSWGFKTPAGVVDHNEYHP